MDSIVWAFKHTMRDIADTGLQIVYELLVWASVVLLGFLLFGSGSDEDCSL